jgi:hypothetical protein
MKKLFLLIVVSSLTVCAVAQIVSFDVVSSKTYDNNTSTYYLKLVGDFDKTMCEEIVSELESYPEIHKFSFYDKSNLMNCMFTAELSYDAEKIVQLINDMVENPGGGVSSGFVNVWENASGFEIFFQIDDIASDLQRRQIEEVLMKDTAILNAVVNLNDCKIIISQQLSPEYVQDILDKFGVKIRPNSIK